MSKTQILEKFNKMTDPENGPEDTLFMTYDDKLEDYPESQYELDRTKVRQFISETVDQTRCETVEEFVKLSHQEWPNGGDELEEIEWIAAHHFGVILDQLPDKQKK